jgi:CubicO group peptidase (beta-lactamase class C family)
MLQEIEALVGEYYPGQGDPGCAVLVASGDDAHMWARGTANLESKVPITAETNFRLASVSKQFTAACVLQLRDRGRLHLNQPLTDFFPDFNSYGHGIHVHHLLRHTLGIRDYEKLIPDCQSKPVLDADIVEILANQNECDFEPGSQFRYSNSGYAVLAIIVETISGLRFAEYLRDNIFSPLDMIHTLAYVDEPGAPEVPNRAIGYALNKAGEFVWSDQNITTAVLGDGGIYCSATDYAKWIRGYRGGKVIEPATLAEALQPGKTSAGDVVPYGYGWRLEQLDATTWRPYHPGSTSGFRNGVVMDHKGEWAVLVLSNRCNGDAVSLAGEIARVVQASGR